MMPVATRLDGGRAGLVIFAVRRNRFALVNTFVRLRT